jgi:hypothetical protein
MVSGSKAAGQLHATNMPDGERLGALYSVKKWKIRCGMAEGSRFRQASSL